MMESVVSVEMHLKCGGQESPIEGQPIEFRHGRDLATQSSEKSPLEMSALCDVRKERKLEMHRA
jgi:hypothetical protein